MQSYPQSVERLLKRKPISIDRTRSGAAIADKTVLVTGAGGSIASGLCRRLAEFGPRRLILLDKSEHGLYQVGLDLEAAGEVTPILGDICDRQFLERVFDDCRPEVVFHCAAYKHVPLLEYQPHAAIRNNVIGTYALARAVVSHRVPRLVMISTDKAVNPTSVMGVSKRIAELVVMGMSAAECRMTSVRLGNVLGSLGSVVPRFADQIRKRRPLTVTDPGATRYFMTPIEAADLVLAAAWLGAGADILVPDVGEPVRIVDLAREMIREAGCGEGDIVFTGLGPGEKLSEELLGRDERAVGIGACGVRKVVGAKMQAWEIEHFISRLEPVSGEGDTGALIRMVREIVPEYRPSLLLAEAAGQRR